MRDDERYPTVISPDREYSDAPEVAPQPLDYYGRDKLAVGQKDAENNPNASEGPIPVGSDHPRTYCGLRKRTFFIVLAVAIIVVIAVVVGGTVGGIAANKHSSSSSDSDSDSASDSDSDQPATTTGASGPQETGPIEASQRGLAVSSSSGASAQDVQVFYQDLNTTDILFRRVKDDAQSGDEQKLDLDITPLWGSPLAAAAINDTDPVEVQVFYLATDKDHDDALAIVQASLECETDGDACKTKTNSIITSNSTHTVHDDSKLAAVRADNETIRVYYQIKGGDVYALNGDDADTKGWSENHIASNVISGGSIAVSASSKEYINFFWISSESSRLRWMRYNDILGPGDNIGIDPSPGSAWSTNVSLAGVWVPAVNPYRVFYAQPTQGDIVSYFQSESDSNDWNTNHDDAWGQVEGGLGAAAFSDQLRLFYFQDGDLVMSAQNASVWSDPESLDNS